MSDHRPVFAQFVLMTNSTKKMDRRDTNENIINNFRKVEKDFGQSNATTTCNIF